jgi:hypothetical protein
MTTKNTKVMATKLLQYLGHFAYEICIWICYRTPWHKTEYVRYNENMEKKWTNLCQIHSPNIYPSFTKPNISFVSREYTRSYGGFSLIYTFLGYIGQHSLYCCTAFHHVIQWGLPSPCSTYFHLPSESNSQIPLLIWWRPIHFDLPNWNIWSTCSDLFV